MTDTAVRTEILLGDLDLDRQVGLEFGALDRPLVPVSERVWYVDHLSTDALRTKYADHERVATDRIVDVRVVLDGRPLVELVAGQRFDFVVASHVIEHVPDPVSWFEELCAVLAPGGSIRLAIPDMRFTFDRARRATELSDLIAAWAARATRPLPHQVIEAKLQLQSATAGEVWNRDVPLVPTDREAMLRVVRQASELVDPAVYHDVHCWTFTPSSFATLMMRLVELGLTSVGCSRFEHTRRGQLEFFAVLAPMDAATAQQSWVAALESLDAAEADLPARLRDLPPNATGLDAGQSAALVNRVADLEAQLAAVHSSRAWRVFEPYRRVRRRIGR